MKMMILYAKKGDDGKWNEVTDTPPEPANPPKLLGQRLYSIQDWQNQVREKWAPRAQRLQALGFITGIMIK